MEDTKVEPPSEEEPGAETNANHGLAEVHIFTLKQPKLAPSPDAAHMAAGVVDLPLVKRIEADAQVAYWSNYCVHRESWKPIEVSMQGGV